MLVINVITLFPQLFSEHLRNLPFKRALERDLIKVNLINLRDFAVDKRGTVDDKPFGGGTGMIIMPEPVFRAVESLGTKENIVLLAPSGKKFTQQKADQYAKLKELTLICGRYEGVDHRVKEHLATETVSVGDYVVSGGELPALIIMESVTRLIPGVLEKDATTQESFTNNLIEHPQYTRPENFKGHKVPEVLLSGNHTEIQKWKEENNLRL